MVLLLLVFLPIFFWIFYVLTDKKVVGIHNVKTMVYVLLTMFYALSNLSCAVAVYVSWGAKRRGLLRLSVFNVVSFLE